MDENTKNELESLGVNVEAAVSRFAGKSERYIKYLKMHVMTGYFSKLGDALKEGNVSDAQLFSHTLKGDFRNYCKTFLIGLLMFNKNYFGLLTVLKMYDSFVIQ